MTKLENKDPVQYSDLEAHPHFDFIYLMPNTTLERPNWFARLRGHTRNIIVNRSRFQDGIAYLTELDHKMWQEIHSHTDPAPTKDTTNGSSPQD